MKLVSRAARRKFHKWMDGDGRLDTCFVADTLVEQEMTLTAYVEEETRAVNVVMM